MPKRKMKPKRRKGKETGGDLLDDVSPFSEAFKIPATTPTPKEDVYGTFERKAENCIDYNISHTYIKCLAGETNINVTQTRGEFVPAPPKAKRKFKPSRYFSGGPPLEKTVEEVWLEAKEAKMAACKRQRNKAYIRAKMKAQNAGVQRAHDLLLSLAGPEWYQELSPKQLDTVDALEYCIYKDYKDKTSINTKENIAALGLVLRPKSEKLELALRYCCGDPVEFLLVLYQLSNPNRNRYSINDRLILSAVVHLTITMTLREMHVRVPSPPKKEQVVEKVVKTAKKKKCSSPYLEPCPVIPHPEPQKDFNRPVQHPESPYFSYKENLAIEMKMFDQAPSASIVTTEVREELRNAQTYYDTLHGAKGRLLLPPTIIKRCPDFSTPMGASGSFREFEMLEKKLRAPFAKIKGICFVNSGVVNQTKCGRLFHLSSSYQPEDPEHPCRKREVPCGNDGKEVPEETEASEEMVPESTVEEVVKVEEEAEEEEEEDTEEEEEEKPIPPTGLVCRCKKRKIIGTPGRKGVTFVLDGICLSKCGPVYVVAGSVTKHEESEAIRKPRVCCTKPEDGGTCDCGAEGKCACVRKRKDVLARYQNCYGVSYVIGGVTMTEVGPAFILSGAAMKKEPKKEEVVEEEKKEECRCKEAIERYLKHRCECDKCREQERLEHAIYIVAGMKEREEEEMTCAIPIIAGTLKQCKCDCLERWLEKLKRVHEYRKRMEARWRMMAMDQKYAIGGVAQTQDGPVYVVTGIRPPVQCPCADAIRRKEEQEEAQRRMPEPPHFGRVRYEIQGVKQTPDGCNVFVLSQALATEPCRCERLYNRYQEAHKSCAHLYTHFQEKIVEAKTGWGAGEKWYECDPRKMRKKLRKTAFSEHLSRAQSFQSVENKSSILTAASSGMCLERNVGETTPEKVLAQDENLTPERELKVEENLADEVLLPDVVDVPERKRCICGGTSLDAKICEPPPCEPIMDDDAYDFELGAKKKRRKKEEDTSPLQATEETAEGVRSSTSTTEDRPAPEAGEEAQKNMTCACEKDESGGSTSTITVSGSVKAEQPGDDPKTTSDADRGFKRYVILKKIPRDEAAQMKVVKKVLESLAEDGYPLALLPEAHKLPHFKLWMQMRAGKVWNQKDVVDYFAKSLERWDHTEICYKLTPEPQMDLGNRKPSSYTWSDYHFLRAMVASKYEWYRRQLKQATINGAREFFPTTFAYEFPFKTFRDCFFAYLPSKEEDLFFPYDKVRPVLKRYQCC